MEGGGPHARCFGRLRILPKLSPFTIVSSLCPNDTHCAQGTGGEWGSAIIADRSLPAPDAIQPPRGNGLIRVEVSIWIAVRDIFFLNAFCETGGEFLP
jgi:hypothetical protein